LSNNATDFEIAKTLLAFPLRFNIVVFNSPSSPNPLGTPFHIYYEYQSITDLFCAIAKLKDMYPKIL
jgi:hypothetical protein